MGETDGKLAAKMTRRGMIEGTTFLAAGAALSSPVAAAEVSDPMLSVPLPPQMPAREGLAQLPGTRLGYWDTGGDGPAIVLLHPATGSALIWGYQQPVFARAGYRVIAYSRRGYHNSEPVPRENPGTASHDLHNLVEFLGLRKLHAVGPPQAARSPSTMRTRIPNGCRAWCWHAGLAA